MMRGFTYYKLKESSVEKMKKIFPPQYPKFIGHHITWKFGDITEDDIPDDNAAIQLVGYTDSEDGLEALVVSINGNTKRPDGSTYHITWSLDPSKYKPVDSNDLLKTEGWTPLFYKLFIHAVPDVKYFKN